MTEVVQSDLKSDIASGRTPLGEFPFPLSDGPSESRYLTWVRNHANYMAAGGLVDYVRALAILVRGVVVNVLVYLPVLIMVAFLVYLCEDSEFIRTRWALYVTAAWVLALPLLTPLWQLLRNRARLESGSESSVKLRDQYERSFGYILILLAGAVSLETMPILAAKLDAATGKVDWPQILTVGGTLAALGASDRLLSRLSGVVQKLAAVAIGLLGFLVPLFIILKLSLLIGDEEPRPLLQELVLWALVALAAAVLVQMVVTFLSQRGFYRKWMILYPLVISLIILVGLSVLAWDGLAEAPTEWQNAVALLILGFCSWLFCWFAVDINLTSIHGLYRDRLAAAFLVGEDTEGDVDIEQDLDLAELCRHEAGSHAPYHLINAALNLQGSKAMEVRDRQSDFFVFSKRFIGGNRTGYCRSESMEHVFPQMGLSSAMAISAAAAAPNMGRSTNPALVFLMAILNIRLGYWIPNPGRLEDALTDENWREHRRDHVPLGITFEGPGGVFAEELEEIKRRWTQLPGGLSQRSLSSNNSAVPTVSHDLVGLAFSGGGIRSATLNLGIAQALHQFGTFDHVDYLSTVSGGGYLGSSLSALMRRRTLTTSEIDGIADLKSDAAGRITISVTSAPDTWWQRLVRKLTGKPVDIQERSYTYESFAEPRVLSGDRVRPGQRLINTRALEGGGSLSERFGWRVRPIAFLFEMLGMLEEHRRWVNVSDGGHIENLATFELLRRRCRYIIIGDGGADPEHRFNGLATLIRLARIDLGIRIEIDLDTLRLSPKTRLCDDHWVLGRIHYPGEETAGYLLYLKSSITGDEDEVIREYRHGQPTFPHESTADQFFGEGQFEAYRSLGQHVAEQVLQHAPKSSKAREAGQTTFADFETWFKNLAKVERPKRESPHKEIAGRRRSDQVLPPAD